MGGAMNARDWNEREVRRAQAIADGTPWPDRVERRRLQREAEATKREARRRPLTAKISSVVGIKPPKPRNTKRPSTPSARQRAADARAFLRAACPPYERREVVPHQGPPLRPVGAAMLRWLEGLHDPSGELDEWIVAAHAYNRRIEQDRWPL